MNLLTILSETNKKGLYNIEGLFLNSNGTYRNISWPFSSDLVVSEGYRTLELQNDFLNLIDKTSKSRWSIRTTKIESITPKW